MTTVIDDHAVAVDSFADLRDALQNANACTTVYLAADIQMTGGIAILPTRPEVTIDGLYPPDGTGTVHTLRDYASSSTGDTLGIRSAGSISMTLRNLNIVGQNYYGVLYVPEGSAYAGVTVTLEHVTYTGPQVTYNPSGATRYLDCDITIDASGYSPANEAGEVCRVEIGGVTTIRHTTPSGYSMFWFRGTAPSLTILAGADVRLQAAYDMLYAGSPVTLTVQPGARIFIDTLYGICRDSAHRFASILVDRGAQFLVEQDSGRGSATLYCNGAVTVNEGATFYMYSTHTAAPPLLYFSTTGASLTLDNPRDFVLYSAGQVVFYFLYATPISLRAQQYNLWATATAYETAGDFDDIPSFSWRKADGGPAILTGSSSSAGTAISAHNFTADELAGLPPLSYFHLMLARVFSCGDLPLRVDPVTDDGRAVTGATAAHGKLLVQWTADAAAHTAQGQADETGAFSVRTDAPIPAGTGVEVVANIPFLLSHAALAAEDAGELVLETAPRMLPFVVRAVARSPVVLFGREESGWSLRVTDKRVRGGAWYLYASVDAPMTGDVPAHNLPGSLVFVDAQDTVHELGGTPTLIAGGENGEPAVIDVRWDAARGVLLRAVNRPFYNGERYTATITWTLSDAPL